MWWLLVDVPGTQRGAPSGRQGCDTSQANVTPSTHPLPSRAVDAVCEDGVRREWHDDAAAVVVCDGSKRGDGGQQCSGGVGGDDGREEVCGGLPATPVSLWVRIGRDGAAVAAMASPRDVCSGSNNSASDERRAGSTEGSDSGGSGGRSSAGVGIANLTRQPDAGSPNNTSSRRVDYTSSSNNNDTHDTTPDFSECFGGEYGFIDGVFDGGDGGASGLRDGAAPAATAFPGWQDHAVYTPLTSTASGFQPPHVVRLTAVDGGRYGGRVMDGVGVGGTVACAATETAGRGQVTAGVSRQLQSRAVARTVSSTTQGQLQPHHTDDACLPVSRRCDVAVTVTAQNDGGGAGRGVTVGHVDDGVFLGARLGVNGERDSTAATVPATLAATSSRPTVQLAHVGSNGSAALFKLSEFAGERHGDREAIPRLTEQYAAVPALPLPQVTVIGTLPVLPAVPSSLLGPLAAASEPRSSRKRGRRTVTPPTAAAAAASNGETGGIVMSGGASASALGRHGVAVGRTSVGAIGGGATPQSWIDRHLQHDGQVPSGSGTSAAAGHTAGCHLPVQSLNDSVVVAGRMARYHRGGVAGDGGGHTQPGSDDAAGGGRGDTKNTMHTRLGGLGGLGRGGAGAGAAVSTAEPLPTTLPAAASTVPVYSENGRTLPESAVAVLRAWMMSPEHVDHPYPSDEEKAALAAQTGISTKQVSIWFTNARKRIWVPLRRKQGLMASPTSYYGATFLQRMLHDIGTASGGVNVGDGQNDHGRGRDHAGGGTSVGGHSASHRQHNSTGHDRVVGLGLGVGVGYDGGTEPERRHPTMRPVIPDPSRSCTPLAWHQVVDAANHDDADRDCDGEMGMLEPAGADRDRGGGGTVCYDDSDVPWMSQELECAGMAATVDGAAGTDIGLPSVAAVDAGDRGADAVAIYGNGAHSELLRRERELQVQSASLAARRRQLYAMLAEVEQQESEVNSALQFAPPPQPPSRSESFR